MIVTNSQFFTALFTPLYFSYFLSLCTLYIGVVYDDTTSDRIRNRHICGANAGR